MIYLTVIYYGSFPNYFQLYLDSVRVNKDLLRIILITDIDLSKYKIPTNVIHFNLSLQEVRERAKLFFQTEYNIIVPIEQIIKFPYKLCDYRPIYHEIFKDIYEILKISCDDYIGWTDVDVIYGKISSFLDLKNNYNIIGEQGHFTAIKNENKFKDCYKYVPLMINRLIDERSLFVDENAFIDILFEKFKSELNVFKMYNYHCDITPWQNMPGNSKELTMSGRNNEIINYLECENSNGKLFIHFMDGRIQETVYCHLQKRTMMVDFEKNVGDKYYITSDNFTLHKPIKNEICITHQIKDQVTIVLTSCNRPQLLDKTLETFVKYNTYPIYQTIIIDDSGALYCNTEICKKYKQLNITEIYNVKNIGQIASIDKAYAMVKTDWIFHCEEDWEFLEYGFIEKSMKILKSDNTDKIFTVWLRPHNDTSGHPIIKDTLGRGYYEMSRDYLTVNDCLWRGITLNPGLRKTLMCMKFHPYMKHCKILLDYTKINEYSLNDLYGNDGYYAVILDKESGHVKHIGWDHSTNPSR